MKKWIYRVILLLLLFNLSGCGTALALAPLFLLKNDNKQQIIQEDIKVASSDKETESQNNNDKEL